MTRIEMNTTIEVPKTLADAQAFASTMTEQLRMAGLVQRDFLPTHLPNSSRIQWAASFFPAEWVSGDIYDVARLDEHYIGFYIADVVGHGIPAALLTMFLKQALVMRETTGNKYNIFQPADVMKNLNQRMTAQKLSGQQFATCCYCLLNIDTLELTFARAGHPHPILIRPGQQPRQLEVPGTLLGIFEQAEFPQHTVQLQAGDKILLYSDGAEDLIGGISDTSKFIYSNEFCFIKDLPVIHMLNEFDSLINVRRATAEIDDITLLALQIL